MSKVMLVTGGGRGIGAATARLAAGRGYAVAVNYAARRDAAEALVAEIEAAGGKAVAIRGDVSKEADVLRLFDETDEAFGRLDAVVNNAGIVTPIARLEEMSAERFERVLAVNVFGAMVVAREAVKRLSTRNGGPGGALVNVSSRASTMGAGGMYVDYAASKGAMDSLTIGLAKEVAAEGVRVNAVRPGIIETEIHSSIGLPDRVAEIAHTIPMGRGGTAEEVAESILWLASDSASYVTGALLDVSGGR